MNLLKKVWNFDFYSYEKLRVGSAIFSLIVVSIAVGYPISQVFFGMGMGADSFNISKYIEVWQSRSSFTFTYKNFEDAFPHIWLLLGTFCVIMRIAIIIRSYFLSKKEIGEEAFKKLFATGMSAFAVGIVSGILILALLAGFAQLTGLGLKWEGNPIRFSVDQLSAFVDSHVPSLLKVQNYWLAFVLIIFLRYLPGYFAHWLTHQSRFFWLITHRSHHVMEYLYPTASADAFSFTFLLHIPTAVVGILVSKLVYTQPMVMEVILLGTVVLCFEAFNHSLAHYQLCYSNPIIRNVTRLFGDLGVYHLVHHSAKPEDHTINLGGSPFNFWDRLFGTYRKPYKETPPVGLTNNPPIHHNPVRIIYSGIAQLIYEWRINKNWLIRLKILFGNIWYKPPVTKDFLILPFPIH